MRPGAKAPADSLERRESQPLTEPFLPRSPSLTIGLRRGRRPLHPDTRKPALPSAGGGILWTCCVSPSLPQVWTCLPQDLPQAPQASQVLHEASSFGCSLPSNVLPLGERHALSFQSRNTSAILGLFHCPPTSQQPQNPLTFPPRFLSQSLTSPHPLPLS